MNFKFHSKNIFDIGHRSSVIRLFSLYLILCTLYLILSPSCKKDKTSIDLGYAYFPNNVGHYVIYQIDSTAQDDRSGVRKNYQFQIKEVIESIFTDNSGRPTMRLERYRKNYDSLIPYNLQPWTGPHIFAANLTTTTGERVEENIRYTRIIFPVKANGVTWNENANNIFEAWNCQYTSVDQPDNINSLSFDSVATVTEENVTDLVETKYALAKYAKHVGMIYRQVILVSKQFATTGGPYPPQPPFQDTIGLPAYTAISNKAIILTQKIIGWGN